MTTLVEFMILSGGDNRPPMLDKDLYDSWKSIMEQYMQNREHIRMILESVEHGLLIWLTIEENRVTKTKKYAELSATEKIQADYDLKETNIILQGLPSDIYSLVNHHRVAKDLWEINQLLIKYGVTCEDKAKRRNSRAKTKTFEENYYLLSYAVSNKEDTAYQRQLITRICVKDQFPIRRITLHPYVVCTVGHQ
ncbi:hypothetical protein Tco_1465617 [Tanacetum coccineum]